MDERFERVKSALERKRIRLAGTVIEDGKESLSIQMNGYIVEVSRESIERQEEAASGAVVLDIRPDAKILITNVKPVSEIVAVLSTKVVSELVNGLTDCCECSYCTDCTECSYCTDCTECSYCTERSPGLFFTDINPRMFPGRLGGIQRRRFGG